MTTPIYLNLACEDAIHEAVLGKIVLQTAGKYEVLHCYRRGGYGYLKTHIFGWNAAAQITPFFVLTDLDRNECPVTLMKDWLPGKRHPQLIFRVAVREVEAWLLADRANLAKFLSVSQQQIPNDPESIPDPKAVLVQIAKKSKRREIREDLVPAEGTTVKQGPNYNGQLCAFIIKHWDLQIASTKSRSLSKAILRLSELVLPPEVPVDDYS